MQEIIDEYKEQHLFAMEDTSNKKLLELFKEDYSELIDLRQRVENSEDFYQEDVIILDHALDNMELLIAILTKYVD